jgi:1,4-alpha-glucan branching enzyme
VASLLLMMLIMKMKILFCTVLMFWAVVALSQTVTTNPPIPRADEPVTITVNVTGTSLNGYSWNNATSPVWIWAWIAEECTSNCDAPTNINPATSAQDAAKVTRISTNPDVYQITITPTTFFNKPASEIKKIGLKLKTVNWNDNKQTDNDRFVTFFSGFVVNITQPSVFPLFKSQGETVSITANASEVSDLTIKVNGATVKEVASTTMVTLDHIVSELPGAVSVTVEAYNGLETKTSSFEYIVRTTTVNQSRPIGIIDGINYDANDPTKVTLSLWAPTKSSVYVVGDFTGWSVQPEYLMKKDGEHFWIEVSGLEAMKEYAFHYLLDEAIYVADPYADKILDPDDQYIPNETYPNLMEYPSAARKQEWYFNRLSVLQTNQEDFTWQVENFVKPKKEALVIYELLIRDFFDIENRNFQNLIDTIGYFKRLGVNAIELMPVMEFAGNDSWGYNPTFMFAVDKYYGTKNKLKEFIDRCHAEGIAVILDIVLNHQDTPHPYLLMDFNFTSFKPNPTNPWFNVEATHPFSVFFDMNHESAYTKSYADTVNHYWLTEFKADGLRFDLSKGFTQKNTGTDVGFWSAKDDSRIALLKRMYDDIEEHSPGKYLILEHFADNSEEKILSDYGFMFWGNLNHAYSQMSLGFSDGATIAGSSYKNRSWTSPNLVAYMESHDEERMMFRNLQFGNVLNNYSIKNLKTALERVKLASAFFFTIPGPKMIWQFGELGYDVSIDYNGRVGQKPLHWEYYENADKKKLWTTFSHLIKLKTSYDLFQSTDFTIQEATPYIKQITLRNSPYTASPTLTQDMNAVVVGNYDVSSKTVTMNFPHTGNWFHYFSGGDTLKVDETSISATFAPGEFRLYTDVKLPATEDELMAFVKPASPELLEITESAQTLTLHWADNSEIETEFQIFRRVEDGPWELIGSAGKNDVSFEDTNDIVSGVSYTYYITAVNTFGKSTSEQQIIETSNLVTSSESLIGKAVFVYPNPVQDMLYVLERGTIVFEVSAISLQGKRVPVKQIDQTAWNVSDLAPGIYFLEMKTSRGTVRVKMIKA